MRPSYKCETCKLSFKHKCDFLRHQTKKKSCLPPGRSRYVCDLCTRTFSRSAKLQAHLKSAAHRARVVETGGTLEALEGEDAPAPETSVEPEVPEEVPVIDLSPCTVCDTVPFTSELRRDNHYNSQTHRDAVRRRRRDAGPVRRRRSRRPRSTRGSARAPIRCSYRDVYDDVAARRMADAEDSDEEGPPSRALGPGPGSPAGRLRRQPVLHPLVQTSGSSSGLTDDQAVRFVRSAARWRERCVPCDLRPAVAGARVCRPSGRLQPALVRPASPSGEDYSEGLRGELYLTSVGRTALWRTPHRDRTAAIDPRHVRAGRTSGPRSTTC